MTRTTWKSAFVMIVKLAIIMIVVYFIGRAIQRAQADFVAQNYSLRTLRPGWLALASISYLIGIYPMASFWHRLLLALGERAEWFPTIRAHYVGQLGKYVPGKAMVLAIRWGMVRQQGVEMTAGVLSVFCDTLTMMSVGAVLALLQLAAQYRDQPHVLALAVLMTLAAAIPSSPPAMRLALTYLYRRRMGREPDAAQTSRLTSRVLAPGWLGVAAGWVMLGVSMWATLKALDLPETRQLSLRHIPEVTAVVAASVVGGFASILPAGLGVREWIYNELLTPRYGSIAGVLAPGLSRLVWLVSELTISGIFYLGMSRAARAAVRNHSLTPAASDGSHTPSHPHDQPQGASYVVDRDPGIQ